VTIEISEDKGRCKKVQRPEAGTGKKNHGVISQEDGQIGEV